MGVVYIVSILTLHISEIKHNGQFQTFKSNRYRILILPLPIFTTQNEHGQGVSHAVGDSRFPKRCRRRHRRVSKRACLTKYVYDQ